MWVIIVKGDIHDPAMGYELSVAKDDNRLAQSSWGWGGTEKIVLFSDGLGGNHLNPRTPENVAFAISVAEKLRDALNDA